jgi:uncharacterized membrane protein YdjX (TVP38/TMEM64 family)
LFQVAILTQIVVLLLEFSLPLVVEQSAIAVRLWALLFAPPLGIFTGFCVAMLVGALAVVILERMRRVVINASSLWALVFCLFVMLLVRPLIPVPAILLDLGELQLFGMIIGVFWKARRYWHWSSRW